MSRKTISRKANNIVKRLTNDGLVKVRNQLHNDKEFNILLNDIYNILDDKGLLHTTLSFSTCECVIALVRE